MRSPTYTLILRPLPDHTGRDPDGILRLRRLLKAMLRGYGIRCLSVAPTEQKKKKSRRPVSSAALNRSPRLGAPQPRSPEVLP